MGRQEQKRLLNKSMKWMKSECDAWLKANTYCNGCDLMSVCKQRKKMPKDMKIENLRGRRG